MRVMPNRSQGWAPTLIGEYSYGMSMTWELVHRIGGVGSLRAAPLVPSLQQEAYLGFDVAVESDWVTLLLQYKVATRLKYSSARESRWMGVPYFRFYVKTDVTDNGQCQHNTLVRLQQRLAGSMEYVYYVAPLFDTTEEFNHHMLNGDLADSSVFVAPSKLGLVNPGDSHCFAYTCSADVTPFSEPAEPASAAFEGLLGALADADAVPEGRLLGDELRRSYEALTQGLNADLGEYEGPESLRRAAALLDLQVVVVQRPLAVSREQELDP